MTIKLKFTGSSREYIPGVPARDLYPSDIALLTMWHDKSAEQLIAEITARGLYKLVDKFTCAECDEPFKTRAALSKHEKEHIKELTKLAEEENDDGDSINSI